MPAHALKQKVIGGTRAWVAGSGPNLVVVHGGPGFSHAYLVDPLLPLASHFRLVFFDQRRRAPGGGGVDASSLTRQLSAVLAATEGSAGTFVLGHSWGSWLVLASLAQKKAPRVDGAVLVSPVPLTATRFREAQDRQAKAIGAYIARKRLDPPPGQDLEGMQALLPSYLAPGNRGRVTVRLSRFDARAYASIMASLPDYDFTKACAFLPRPTHLIYGEEDVAFVPSGTREIHRCANVDRVAGAAHFAFAERPRAFRSLVLGLLG